MIFVLQSERTSQLCRRRRRRTTTTTTRIAMKMACTLITTRQHNDLRHRATHGKGRPTVGNNLPMKTLACNVTRHFVASASTYKTTVRETKINQAQESKHRRAVLAKLCHAGAAPKVKASCADSRGHASRATRKTLSISLCCSANGHHPR